MAYYFDNATLLGYSLDKKYGSENNDFILNTVKNISLQGILDYKGLNKDAAGVKDYFNDIKSITASASGDLQSITVNGYNLGHGRIKAVTFDKKDPILFGKYKYDIEIIEQSNLSGLSGDYYGTFIPSIKEKILNLDENFTFNYTNSKYNYSHNLNIKLARSGENEDLITKIKNLASGILNDTINLGLLGEYSGYYNTLKNKKNTSSETYDLIENSFSFGKSIEIDKNYSGDYSIGYKHVLANDNFGKTNVQEDASINFLTKNLTDLQKNNIFNNEISNSYSRCSGLFSDYSLKYNIGTSFAQLNLKPYIMSKKNNIFEEKIDYSVSYVNDITYYGGYFLNYEVNSKTNNIGEIETIENGDVYVIGDTGTIYFPASVINSRKSNYQLIKSYNNSYTILHTGTNYDNLFKYSITSTNNIYYRPNSPVTFLSVSTDVDKPTKIITEFIFPKKISKINSSKNKLGQISTKIKAVIPSGRASDSALLFKEINYTSSSAAYLTKATYSYDSEGNVSAQFDQAI